MLSKIPLPDLSETNYWVDPYTNPSTWNGVVPQPGKYRAAYKVEVCFVNVGQGSLRGLHTGRNDSVHEALKAVIKHVARGFYRIVSLQMSEYSCVAVMKSDMSNEEMDKISFPWGREVDPDNVVTLR